MRTALLVYGSAIVNEGLDRVMERARDRGGMDPAMGSR
jgi:hypothetical protein